MTEKPTNDTCTHSVSYYLPPVVLAVVCALIYANSLFGPFFFDDHITISENDHIRQLWPPLWLTPASDNSPLQGRCVVSFSVAVNYALDGMNVRGYHAYNIAIHILCAWTLFGVVGRTLTGAKLRARFGPAANALAFTCALLWMLHPLLTECVDYVTQRTESMMSLFYLLTLYCAIRAADSTHRFGWRIAAVLACCLGMACKEVMVTAPLMIFFYDLVFSADSFSLTLRRRWPLYLGLAASWVVLATMMLAFPLGNVGLGIRVGPWDYAKNQCLIIVHYLRLVFWPHPLAIDYGFAHSRPFVEAAPYAALLLVLLIATILTVIRRPMIGFLAAWSFIILGPTSSFAPMTTEVGAERRMYLPLVGIIVLLVLLGHFLLERLTHRLAKSSNTRLAPTVRITLVIVLASLCGWATLRRNTDYRSEIAIWQSAIKATPDNMRAYTNLGNAYQEAGQIDQAVSCYRQALRIFPDLAPAHNNLGLILRSRGQIDQAISHFRRAVDYRADFTAARQNLADTLRAQGKLDQALVQYQLLLQNKPENLPARCDLADVLAAQGKTDQAINIYRQILHNHPEYGAAHFYLAVILQSQGDIDRAINHFQSALAGNPRHAPTLYYLGVLFKTKGRLDQAVTYFKQALQINGDWPAALNTTAWILATHTDPKLSDPDTAIRFARRAAELTKQNDPLIIDTLAAAYAAAGQFEQAVQTAQIAIALAKTANADQLAHDIAQRLEIYRQSKPYHELPINH